MTRINQNRQLPLKMAKRRQLQRKSRRRSLASRALGVAEPILSRARRVEALELKVIGLGRQDKAMRKREKVGAVGRMPDQGCISWQVETRVQGMRRASSLGIQMTRTETWVVKLLSQGR